jgi:hypothetical protein
MKRGRQLMGWMAPSRGIECHSGGRRRSPVTGAIHGQYYSKMILNSKEDCVANITRALERKSLWRKAITNRWPDDPRMCEVDSRAAIGWLQHFRGARRKDI